MADNLTVVSLVLPARITRRFQWANPLVKNLDFHRSRSRFRGVFRFWRVLPAARKGSGRSFSFVPACWSDTPVRPARRPGDPLVDLAADVLRNAA